MKLLRAYALLQVLCCWGLGTSAFAIEASPHVVTFRDAVGNQQIYCFAASDSGHLVANYFDLFQWKWQDYGLPAGVWHLDGATMTALVATDAKGYTLLYVFAVGDNGHLVLHVGNRWYDQGVPDGVSAVSGSTTAITYVDPVGYRHFYAFVEGDNGHLYVNYFDGFNWHWADQGYPNGTPYFDHLSAITYLDSTLHQRICVFAQVAATARLTINYWDGFNWHWADQGWPSGAQGVVYPTAITYRDGLRNQRIYVFAEGYYPIEGVNHLVVNYWDGSHWHWADQGQSDSSSLVMNAPSVVTFVDVLGFLRIYTFVLGSTADISETALYLNYWDGLHWRWSDQGDPPADDLLAGQEVNTSTITFRDAAGNQEIYCFAVDYPSAHLVLRRWDGFSWSWSDHGTM